MQKKYIHKPICRRCGNIFKTTAKRGRYCKRCFKGSGLSASIT